MDTTLTTSYHTDDHSSTVDSSSHSEPGIRCGNKDSRRNKNRKSRGGGGGFSVGKNRQAYLFSMKIKMMDLWMQIEGTKQTFIMNFSVLDYSNVPPECLRLHRV